MGKWCEYDLLSGSDGGLRLALEFINAAAPDQYYSWDDDVQLYSELSPPDDDRSAEDRSVVLGAVQFTDEFGRHTVFTTQTTEDTYQKIFKLIDAIPAVVWSSPTGFMHVMQFLNSPGDQDAKHGHRERAVWDTTPGSPEGDEYSGRGYKLLCLLLMRAGAAMPEPLYNAMKNEWATNLAGVASDFRSDPGKVFVAQRLCEEIDRYDFRGGRTFGLKFQSPMDVAQGLGSRFRKLNNQPSAFARWQKYSFRKMLPPVERDELRSMPKLWKMGGVTSLTLKPGENTELPPLLRTMQTSAACLALQGRAGRDSPMHALPADLVQQICESVPEIHLRAAQVWRHAGC